MAIKSSEQKRLRRHERTRYLWCTLILVLGLPAWLAVAENANESVRVAQRQSLKDLLKSLQSYRQQSDAATEEALNQQKKNSPADKQNVDVTPPPRDHLAIEYRCANKLSLMSKFIVRKVELV